MLLMGKSTISMVMFNSYFDITRGYPPTRKNTMAQLERQIGEDFFRFPWHDFFFSAIDGNMDHVYIYIYNMCIRYDMCIIISIYIYIIWYNINFNVTSYDMIKSTTITFDWPAVRGEQGVVLCIGRSWEVSPRNDSQVQQILRQLGVLRVKLLSKTPHYRKSNSKQQQSKWPALNRT